MPFDFGEDTESRQQPVTQPVGPRFDFGDQRIQSQGVSGIGALGRGVARGVAGIGQAAESFGVRLPGQQVLESAGNRQLAPGIGPAVLSGIGEALPAMVATAPLGVPARGAAALTAMGAGAGAIGGATRFSDKKLSPRERGLLATRGAALGAGLGAAGGVVLRTMRGERDLFDRAMQISKRLGIEEVPFAARRAAGVRMFGRTSQRGPSSAGEFATKAADTFQRKILLNSGLRKSIKDQMRNKEEIAWSKFNGMINSDARMDMSAILRTTDELLKEPSELTGPVLRRVKVLNRKARAALGVAQPGAAKPPAPTPVSYAELNDQRRLLGEAFGTDEAIQTIPIAKRNELYATIRETQKGIELLPNVTRETADAAFEEAMAISQQIRNGEKVLHEIMKKKTAPTVANIQTGTTKQIDLKTLHDAYSADQRIQDIIDFATRASMPIPSLGPAEGLIRPIAQGRQIPVSTTGLAGAFGQRPEPILGAGAVGLNFLSEAFRSPPTAGTSVPVPSVPVLPGTR